MVLIDIEKVEGGWMCNLMYLVLRNLVFSYKRGWQDGKVGCQGWCQAGKAGQTCCLCAGREGVAAVK